MVSELRGDPLVTFTSVSFCSLPSLPLPVSENVHAGPWKVELQDGSLASNALGIQIN